jgi:tetratricopeptide (TPR) repeat protein
MSNRTIRVLWTALLAGLFIAPAPARAAEGWWRKAWKRRLKIEIRRTGQRWPDSPQALVRFPAGDDIQEGGGDVRVLASQGRILRHHVVYAAQGKDCEVIFEPPKREGQYFIYYGNPNAQRPKKVLNVERGLILETRSRPAGPAWNWAQMKALLEKSHTLYGRAVRKKIWDGFNPFGPSDYYISIYKGYILCTRPGTYTFATASDDGSFLFVDGKLICQWPGPHGAYGGLWGQHHGEVRLEMGLHRIEYYHEESVGGQACVAGWKRPGDTRFYLIPSFAYPGFLTAKVLAFEKRGSPVAAAFTAEKRGTLKIRGDRYMEVCFTDRSSPAPGSKPSPRWTFGDGVESGETVVPHVFLLPGQYAVTLEVGSREGKDRMTRIIDTEILFREERCGVDEKVKRYCRIVGGYALEKLSTKQLRAAWALFHFGGEEYAREEVRCLEAILRKQKGLSTWELHKAHLRLGHLYLRELKNTAGARKAFDGLVGKGYGVRWEVAGRFGIARVLYRLEKKPEEALKALKAIVGEYNEWKYGEVRLAQILMGDIHRERGELAEALSAYRKAGQLLAEKPDPTLARVKKGAYQARAENFMLRKEFRQALVEIDAWELEFPEEKLTGASSVLKARCNLKLGRYDEVIRDLRALLAVNEKGSASPRALLLLGEAYGNRGDRKSAAKAYQDLIDGFPESGLVKKAKEAIRHLKRKRL